MYKLIKSCSKWKDFEELRKNPDQIWAGYIRDDGTGFRLYQIRSIGHKWVYYRRIPSPSSQQPDRYRKITRQEWDEASVRPLEEKQHLSEVRRKFMELGHDTMRRCRKDPDHPYGLEAVTHGEMEDVVEAARMRSEIE